MLKELMMKGNATPRVSLFPEVGRHERVVGKKEGGADSSAGFSGEVQVGMA